MHHSFKIRKLNWQTNIFTDFCQIHDIVNLQSTCKHIRDLFDESEKKKLTKMMITVHISHVWD